MLFYYFITVLHFFDFLWCSGKLRESFSAKKDLAKAARTLTELQQLRQSADFSGIVVVDAEGAFITSVAADIRAEASSHPLLNYRCVSSACNDVPES